MILKENYELKHIEELRIASGNDAILIERSLFAFGLLEALRKVELPFIFKGGTCLMLLLKNPKRLSTDIDILVDPNIDVDPYLEKVKSIFPFDSKEEQIRKGKNNITKRHFKFYYDSPTANRIYILLDIVYEIDSNYVIQKKEITNSILLTAGPNLSVDVPSVNSILGDKLCAFAPTTTGIAYNANKDMEIIKQMFDVSCLIDEFNDQHQVFEVYKKSVIKESDFRGTRYSFQDCLIDTIKTCLCICSRGKYDSEHYSSLLYGIRGIKSHIYGTKYTGEVASQDACKVLFFASCLLTGNHFKLITDPTNYLDNIPLQNPFKLIAPIRKENPISYGYVVESAKLLSDIKL